MRLSEGREVLGRPLVGLAWSSLLTPLKAHRAGLGGGRSLRSPASGSADASGPSSPGEPQRPPSAWRSATESTAAQGARRENKICVKDTLTYASSVS